MAEEKKVSAKVTAIDVIAFLITQGDSSKATLKVSELKKVVCNEFGWNSDKYNEESYEVAEKKGFYRKSDMVGSDSYSIALLSLLDPVADKYNKCERSVFLYNKAILALYIDWHISQKYPIKKTPTLSGVSNGQLLLMAVKEKNEKLIELCKKWQFDKETGKVATLKVKLDLDFAREVYESM